MRPIVRLLLCAGALAGGLACAAPTNNLVATARNPGSLGTVRAQETTDGNTRLNVELRHLPPPSAIDPSLNTYVVWGRPKDGGNFRNLGRVDLRSDRSARLQTVSPYDALFIVVTAEPEGTPREPSRYVVLQGEVERGRGMRLF